MKPAMTPAMKAFSRSQFMQLASRVIGLLGVAAIFGPVIAYFFPAKLEEMPSEPVLVAPESDLPPGASKTVRFGRYPALVIHTSQGLRAYSAVCTHFACIVKWDPDLGQVVCPCHAGYFDPLDGRVLSGPPPNGLTVLKVEAADGNIYVGAMQ